PSLPSVIDLSNRSSFVQKLAIPQFIGFCLTIILQGIIDGSTSMPRPTGSGISMMIGSRT
ncbi:MAG: hypothetical protein DRH08_06825, partial [Deltaproteobacteria bacterium]